MEARNDRHFGFWYAILSTPTHSLYSTSFFLHVATALTSSEPEAEARVLWFAVKVADVHFF